MGSGHAVTVTLNVLNSHPEPKYWRNTFTLPSAGYSITVGEETHPNKPPTPICLPSTPTVKLATSGVNPWPQTNCKLYFRLCSRSRPQFNQLVCGLETATAEPQRHQPYYGHYACQHVGVCVTCRVTEGYVGSEPPLDVAYRLAFNPDWCCVLHKSVASHAFQLQLTPAWLTTLTLLLRVSATVTDYRRNRQTLLLLPGIISLFIMCLGIILK